MNKIRIAFVSSITIVAAMCASAYAMPFVAIDQCAGVIGSPLAQLPIQDPVFNNAVEVLNKHLQPVKNEAKPTIPETTISHRHRHTNLDGMLILGGSENVPM